MKSILLKSRFIKCLLAIILIVIHLPAVSQTKDSISKFVIKKSCPCQVILAGKSRSGKDSTYTPLPTMDEILKDPSVRITGCADYTVTSFELVLNANRNTINIVSTSNQLTPEMINYLQQTAKGAYVILQRVHYKLPSGQKGVMPGINFKVY